MRVVRRCPNMAACARRVGQSHDASVRMMRISLLLLLTAAQAFRHSASTLTPPSDGAACSKEVDELKAQNVAQAKELAELKELLKAEVGEEVAGNVTMAAAANPDAFPRCGRNYVLIAHGKECSSGDTLLGTGLALADCATRCEATEGCRYFVHGKQGTSAANKCYYEHTVDACHTDTRGSATNFETDHKYDFYMLLHASSSPPPSASPSPPPSPLPPPPSAAPAATPFSWPSSNHRRSCSASGHRRRACSAGEFDNESE